MTLPTVRSGLATAVILGAARAIGETAPVLLTAGVTTYLTFNAKGGPMMSLPLMAYTSVLEPFPVEIARGFGAAFDPAPPGGGAVRDSRRRIGGRGPGQLRRGAAAPAGGRLAA